MNTATKIGFRRTIPFNCGIFLGTFIVMILCTLFSAALYTLIPRIQLPMKIIGAGYILFLVWKTLSSTFEGRSGTGSFVSGILLQFINPKIIIYGITSLSSFILPIYRDGIILAGFAALLASSALIGTLCWSGFGSLFKRVFSEHGRLVGIVMALLLVYCAVSLFL
jgi:threonine/homoserine/homoserine lactone efflux protein